MKKITLEEHFSVPELSYRLKRRFASANAQELDARLLDVEQWRLPEMDQHGVAVQVLSFTCPGIQGIPDAATAISTCAGSTRWLKPFFLLGYQPDSSSESSVCLEQKQIMLRLNFSSSISSRSGRISTSIPTISG